MTKKKKRKILPERDLNRYTKYLNIFLLILNILGALGNVLIFKDVWMAQRNAVIQSGINIAKENPLFEIQYFEIEKHVFLSLASGKNSLDSLYSDPLKNYYVANNNILNVNADDYSSFYTVIVLSIKQIGGGLAKDVTVEYECLYSYCGLDYFTTTGDDVMGLEEYTEDILGNKVKKEKHVIKYGDIPTGRGLLLPLFLVDNMESREQEIPQNDESNTIWARTTPVVLVPKTLSYKNPFDGKTVSFEIRKMNNSNITYSMYVEGRG